MPTLSQVQAQKMLQKLSPQQIQMIKLLELPTLQLEQRVKQELEENPVLEEKASEESKSEEQEEELTLEDLYEDDTPSYKYSMRNYSSDDQHFTPYAIKGRTLIEFLEEQLGFSDLTQHQQTLARYIIGSIDDDGYLRRGIESISDDIVFSLGIENTVEELEYLLSLIQGFEPAGVGARNLQECLLIQLRARGVNTPERKLAYRILDEFFTEFSKKHFERMLSRLNVGEDDFRDAMDEITSLSPKPGYTYNEGGTKAIPYIIPDFILDYQGGYFDLYLNSSNVPQIRVSRSYIDMVDKMSKKSKERTKEDRDTIRFVKGRIDSAKWFIQAIRQRQDTLMRTMEAILNYQRDYFVDGDVNMLRPMILKDIADITNLDVSTISRVVNSKYIQTHFGIILLKDLFSEAMLTDSGEEVSSYEIKNILQECVDSEDKRKPHTDEALMDLLNEKGYQIARRTVAKYREMLDIPVARLRRDI